MIIRKRKINIDDAEVQLAISFGNADIKRWCTRFVRILVYDPEQMEYWQKATFSEGDIRHWMAKDAFCLATIEEPWQGQLTQWGFRQMVKRGYFVQSGDDPNKYYFSQKALKLANFKSLNWQ